MPADRTVTPQIDTGRCNGCGQCVPVCPSQTISLINGKAFISGNQSLACDHCAAACPVAAIKVPSVQPEISEYRTFSADDRWLPFGDFDTPLLVRLMRSRRSCRNYADRPVARELLEDLVKIGVSAPSGTNSQKWTFTILPSRRDVIVLGNYIAAFYKRLNKLAENRYLRRFLKLMGKNRLSLYYRDYYHSVSEGLIQWDQQGRDLLFHGAPAVLVVGSGPGASCPMEDSLLATQNILLAAHSMGIGTCLIGFAVEAMKGDRSIQRRIGIPAEEKVYAVISMGYPMEKYCRVAGRKQVMIRVFEGTPCEIHFCGKR